MLGAVALFCGVASTTPLLSTDFQRWAFALAIAGAAASLLSPVLVSWRLLR
jgi:hypothetical protein